MVTKRSEQSHGRTALVADDHNLLFVGLEILLREDLGFAKVIEAPSLPAALQQLAAHPETELAFFDLYMPGMNGARSIATVRAAHPKLKIVMLSASENFSDAADALIAGADGFIPKSFSEEKLVLAIETILAGRKFVPNLPKYAEASGRVSRAGNGAGPCGSRCGALLTKRQQDVLEFVRLGHSNRQIAEELGLSENTVANHVSDLFLILNVRNRTELALLS